MFDFELAFYLYKMSAVQRLILDSPYRAKAYYSAALAIDANDRYVERMYLQGALKSIPFVGNKIEACIIEIIETGKLYELEQYEKEYGILDYSLLLCHGLSDNLIKKLLNMSVISVCDLMDETVLMRLKSKLTITEFQKTQNFTKEFQKNQGKYLLAHGVCLGEEIIDFIRGINGVRYARLVGEIFDVNEKISKIEISIDYDGKWEYLIRKLRKFSRLSDLHSRKGMEIVGRTVFGIPFELRYNDNSFVNDSKNCYNVNIKGDLHTHSLWTDGIHSIEQMAKTSMDLGYEYLAITDHSISMKIAHGLSESQVLSQIQEINEYNKNHEFKLLAGIEVDILSDGSLDYSDDILSQLDFVIASIHTNLNQEPILLYDRLKRALENPFVNILAHPTSRLLGRPGVMFCERPPYNIDINCIIELCLKNNVVLEVNCFPERMDLNEKNLLLAVDKGVKISLGSDSHSLAHLCNMKYGAALVKKLKIENKMIINTYSYKQIKYFFENQRMVRVQPLKKPMAMVKKDFHYYFGNNLDIVDGNRKIIGIDLTGSEEKESGWACMISHCVRCKRIKTDNEIIDTIRQESPDIISIDSPLAFPKGRCCSKKECACSRYGIMRKSERMLRHFGITVYPCLIDSMVSLTTRGMRLARTLRDMGYKVIESYPGVAQDILLIPRKGKTMEQFQHLKQGLISFGITGDLIDNIDISHDEVDAITSALVGFFYLNNQYVGLGNDCEDYLIVPRVQEELLSKRIVIGLSGEKSAGKTTSAEYLCFKYGLKYVTYSEIIANKFQTSNEDELQEIGAKIAENEDTQRQLTRELIRSMDEDASYVVDGLRHFEDYDELQKCFGDNFVFVYIESTFSNRYKRYNKSHFDGVSKVKFEHINNHKSENDILLLRFKSDYQLNNNRGFVDLRLQLDNIIKKVREGDV